MYDLTQGFQLQVAPASKRRRGSLAWVLSRRNLLKTTPLIMGQVSLPPNSAHPHALHEQLAQQLNRGGCFEFAYTPQEDDFLRINVRPMPPLWLTFRFQQQQWLVDHSSYFDNWRRQLERLEEGIVAPMPRVRGLFD
jgi:hypothetical protein